MCGVLYFKGDSEKHKGLIIRLLRESKVRGLHAFGVSLRRKPNSSFETIRTFSLHEAEEFIKENEFWELIGHCRYDTSGDWHEISNNQPIVIGENILAFNGVVRMSTKDEYEQEFQREYTTDNDGEIVLRMFAEEDRRLLPLLDQKQVSFAGVVRVDGRSLAIRNERRPLWRASGKGFQFIFSTRDIWERAVENIPIPAETLVRKVPPMEVIWL